jgi:hypothetical protein
MIPTNQQLRDLLETYKHCRKFAHAGEVGANAVVLIAALEELLGNREARAAAHQFFLSIPDIPQHVAGAEEVHGRSRQSQKDDLGAASTRWASSVSNKRWPEGTDG